MTEPASPEAGESIVDLEWTKHDLAVKYKIYQNGTLIDSTKGMFNYQTLSKMKPNSRIVNVARGGIINESDLAKILNEDKIRGAAIDVFENEPISNDDKLKSLHNVILTPHNAANSIEVIKFSIQKLIENIINNLD
mgnify:CR=1 FL=1